MDSFSKEWIEYDYDGTIWDLSYEDHEKRFLSELGLKSSELTNSDLFLEIGCGLGITTFLGFKNFGVDAVGVDLSLAAKGVSTFQIKPILAFCSGIGFPFAVAKRAGRHRLFSRRTSPFSTKAAFCAIVPYCRLGGLLYLWVYGIGSTKGSLLRCIAYRLEEMTRPAISRHLSSPISRIFLALLAYCYISINRFHRLRNSKVQKYDYAKALHAARDRFTPLFAHRQDPKEVSHWFLEQGFRDIEVVDWRTMPVANQDNYRRNTGVRGRRASGVNSFLCA